MQYGLIFKRDKDDETLNEAQHYQLKQLLAWDEDIRIVHRLVQDFRQIVKGKRGNELESWLKRAKATEIKELVSFSQGISRDQKAVDAGISWELSNAQLEGQVNRVKTIKRQMVRRVTRKSITLQESQDRKEYPGVIGITFNRKVRGKGAFQKSS